MEHDINWWAFSVATLIFIVGLIGTLLPVLPGCFIVWIGAVIYYLWDRDGGISGTFILVTAAFTILAQVLDFLASYYGARRFGGSWRGGVGALLGAIFGPMLLSFIPGVGTIVGLLVGPIIGAVLGELSAGRTLKEGGRAGFGTVVGGVVSMALKLGIAVFMVGWFYFETLIR